MRFPKKALIGWMGALLFASLACTLQALRVNTSPQKLEGTQWELDSFGPQGSQAGAVEGARLVMVFSAEDRVGGTDGCNTFEGEYAARFGRLLFQNLSDSRVTCTDQKLLAQEAAYLRALKAAGHYELLDGRLIIWYGDGQNTLIFKRSQPPGLVGGLSERG